MLSAALFHECITEEKYSMRKMSCQIHYLKALSVRQPFMVSDEENMQHVYGYL